VREPGRTYTVGELVSSLQKTGLCVLRNQAKSISLDHSKLWIVGLGDFWVGDCQPMRAFNSVPAGSAKITLVHNPDAIDLLRHTNADAILSGHTHGVNITSSRQLQKIAVYTGMARVDGKVLYINRGLGRHGRPRLRCRPEITVFTLKSSPSAPNAT
jgi:predicted MPP superfamily phosphohydrolase